MISLTFFTAFFASFSTASYFPLETPEGTEAFVFPVPVSNTTSGVSLPPESFIALALSLIIFTI